MTVARSFANKYFWFLSKNVLSLLQTSVRDGILPRKEINDGAIMKIILKTNWQIMHKPLIICGLFPFALTLLFTIVCLVYPRPDIQANPFHFPLFSLTVSLLLLFFFYFIFISIRISFDGEKLTLYQFFLPVKSFSIREIKSVEYSPQTKYLFINRKYAFPSRLFPEKDIDVLLEVLSQRHSIKTGKIWKHETSFLFSSIRNYQL